MVNMRFGTKIAIAVRADLEQWQMLNVTAFLASGIAAAAPDVMGKPYEDGSGNTYLELFRQPGRGLRGRRPGPRGGPSAGAGPRDAHGHLHPGYVRHRSRRR
jgi:hypothetical protein